MAAALSRCLSAADRPASRSNTAAILRWTSALRAPLASNSVNIRRASRASCDAADTRAGGRVRFASGSSAAAKTAGSESKSRDQLPTLGLEGESALAHHDPSVFIAQPQRGHGPSRANQSAHAVEAALDGFHMAPAREQLLGQPHHEQIVEDEPVLAPLGGAGLDEAMLYPIANSIGRDRKDTRRRTSRKSSS